MRNASGSLLMWTIAGLMASAHAREEAIVSQSSTAAIPPQPLASALQTWAAQTGWQLMYDSSLAANQRSSGIPEGLQPIEGLARMLDGTGLVYRFLNDRTVAILSSTGEGSGSAVRPVSTHARFAQSSGGRMLRLASAQADGVGVAQDSTSGGGGPQGGEITEVLVTAQKREERLIDTPQSVSVLSADELSKIGAVQFRDFANTVPGLTFTTHGAGYTQISLRGVTAGIENNPTVGIYVDDVPYGSSSTFAYGARLSLDVGLFDVERIEVLRGPQGTLYGASSLGGLIKYVSKQPRTSGFDASAQLGVSDRGSGGISYNGAMAVNAPIVEDTLALRASPPAIKFFRMGG